MGHDALSSLINVNIIIILKISLEKTFIVALLAFKSHLDVHLVFRENIQVILLYFFAS